MKSKLKVAIMMDPKPGERAKTKTHLLEVVESPNFTVKDLVLKQREVKKQIQKNMTDRGYLVRSISIVADSGEDYDVIAVVQAPIFGSSKKKPVRRSGPQGGKIGRGLKK